MKTRIATLLFVSMAFAGTTLMPQTASVPVLPPKTVIQPEALTRSKDETVHKLKNGRIMDLRELFEPLTRISDLENRHVCLVRWAGVQGREEVHVEGNPSLHDVMSQSATGGAYDGQIRVVSRDSIVQTPLRSILTDRALKIEIHVGDLIFVQGQE